MVDISAYSAYISTVRERGNNMTYHEASETLKNYSGKQLLETLEELKAMGDFEYNDLDEEVKVSYNLVMDGFYKMFYG